jgi:DNA (cytosine-5)-methyltransferase 1
VPRTHSVDEPVPTVPASGSGKFGVVEPFVISAGGANLRQPRSASDPLPTVMGSDRLAVVESFILPQHGGGVLRPDGQPLPTITTDGAIAVVEPFIIDANFGRGDNGHRVRSVDEPLGTLPASNRFGVAEPFLVPFYTERPEEKHARSRSVDEPLPTITGTGSGKLGVVEPFLTKYYGSGDGVSPATEPVPTVTTRDRFGLVEPFIVPNNTNNVPKSIDEPIPTVTGANRLALVQPMINGYVLDIHFRMLQPHELAAATSFPKSYVFTGNREDVVKQIGNSWTGELSFQLNVAAIADCAPARKRRLEAIA